MAQVSYTAYFCNHYCYNMPHVSYPLRLPRSNRIAVAALHYVNNLTYHYYDTRTPATCMNQIRFVVQRYERCGIRCAVINDGSLFVGSTHRVCRGIPHRTARRIYIVSVVGVVGNFAIDSKQYLFTSFAPPDTPARL